jgi:hypothetical protein
MSIYSRLICGGYDLLIWGNQDGISKQISEKKVINVPGTESKFVYRQKNKDKN